MDLTGKRYWRGRKFEPRPLRALGLVLLLFLSAVASGLLGTFVPVGLFFLALGARDLARGESAWGALYFRREDHPRLFGFAVGSTLVAGGLLTVVALAHLLAP